jgi:uncharacterized membrane protein
MAGLFSDWMVQFGLALAGLIVLVGVGFYLVGRLRKSMQATSNSANDHLSNFREMHDQGGLSDEEYRTIKAMLAEPLKQQVPGETQRD